MTWNFIINCSVLRVELIPDTEAATRSDFTFGKSELELAFLPEPMAKKHFSNVRSSRFICRKQLNVRFVWYGDRNVH